MALGIANSKEELISELGPKGELTCEGTMKDGRAFQMDKGVMQVDSGGTFAPATPAELDEVVLYLKARFGKEKIQTNTDGKIIFFRTTAEELSDAVSGATKSVKKAVGGLMGEDLEDDPKKKRAHSLGMVSTARRLLLEGMPLPDVKTHLETEFAGVNDLPLKVQEAMTEAQEATRRMDRAKLRVTQEGLTAKIRALRIANPTWTKAQIETALFAGVKKIKVRIGTVDKDIERSDPEVEEIFEAAFQKEANEDWWKDKKETVFTKENAKTAAKWGAMGLAGAATLTAAGIAGIGALLWKGAKAVAGPVKKVAVGTARLGLNMGRHLVSNGKDVVVAAGQSLIVNPIKAVGTMVSKPFVRAYQAFNWGRKYPAKPTLVQKKWYGKPWQWARNGFARTAYRTKQASLALAAAATFGLYGVGEGITNAASRDLLGTDWTVPAPQFLEHSAPAAPAAAPAAGAHPAPHGAGH